MTLSLKPLTTTRFVMEVEDLDLSQPVDGTTVAALRKEINEHSILVFRGQTIDNDHRAGPIAGFFPACGHHTAPAQRSRTRLSPEIIHRMIPPDEWYRCRARSDSPERTHFSK